MPTEAFSEAINLNAKIKEVLSTVQVRDVNSPAIFHSPDSGDPGEFVSIPRGIPRGMGNKIMMNFSFKKSHIGSHMNLKHRR